jgi:hypothetical protein
MDLFLRIGVFFMKKAFIAICLAAVLLLGACSGDTGVVAKVSDSASPTPTGSEKVILPGGPAPQSQQPSQEATQPPAASASQSSLYDPSIFVIEASDSWQDELAQGYYANNECEIYLHKIDANDNRRVEGSYEGCIWMKTTVDTQEFIQEMLKDVPVDMTFDAGGEAVADNLAISLNTTDDKAWTDYNINGEDGKPLPLTQDTPVGRGSFVMVTKTVYLEAHGSGAQGEKVDYSDAGGGDVVDVNYVIHVQPGSPQSGNQHEVVINLSGEGFNHTMKGVMKILPGYPEDVSDYYNSDEYKNSAWKHLLEE